MKLLQLALCAVVAAAQQQLSVDFNSVIANTYAGMGAVRHGFDYQPEELYRGYNDEYRNLSYQRITDSRLAYARTWYSSDWVMPQGWGTPLDFTTPRFEAFSQWVSDMRQRNVSIVLNAGWWFTQNVCSPGQPSNCTPAASDVAIYTNWISETVRELVLHRGFSNVDTLLLFTEPLTYDSGNVPPNMTQQSFYVSVARALHAQMLQDGTRHLVRFHAPNDGGIDSDPDMQALQYCVSELADVVDIWTSHTYELPDYASWYAVFARMTNVTAPTGSPTWVDEGGAGPEATRNGTDYGTYIALWQAALMNAGASNSFLWLWQDQYYVWPLNNMTNGDSFDNGLHRWGLQFWGPLSTGVRPAYYSMNIMTRFLRPPPGRSTANTVTVTGLQPGSGVIAAAIGTDTYRAVLLVNEANTTASVKLSLTGYLAADAGANAASASIPMSRYLYDPANVPSDTLPIPSSGSYPGDGSPIEDTLPPRGVVVWVTDGVWE
jgi:hypothetical protein